MYLRSMSTILVVLALVFEPISAGQVSVPLVKLATYHISKRPIHTVSDKFLSFTIDPNTIAHVATCQLTNATVNLARSLTPSYMRLAGSDSNKFIFQSNPNSNHSESNLGKQKAKSVSSAEWLRMNEFFAKTGMNVIACVSGRTETGNMNWDLSNTLELITFSDKHNISLDWQLGYELQRLANEQGKNMGHDVTRLRKILDVFSRYRKSLIIGPDMTSFNSRDDAAFVRNYLIEAGDSLDAFTWHPFSEDADEGDYEMLSNGMTTMDNYLWIKDGLLKSSSKGVVPKKSIWIAESENKNSISNITDTMTWIGRMGTAARLGASVYLRKPHLLSLYEPTPEYWAAVLYKSLVGKIVLDIKQTAGNGTNKVHMFTHCTQVLDKPEDGIINPMVAYERGSITVYGINTASESARLSFKIGLKGDETAHLYILTEDASGNFPKTLLNKQPLGLSPENELPIVSPKVRESPKYLVIPGRSIFFVVFPETKCRSCSQQYDDQDPAKTKNKFEEDYQDSNAFTNNVLEVMEDENDHDAVYVSYPKRNENMLKWSDRMSKEMKGRNDKIEISDPYLNVKYVTFSDDTWLSSFPEKLKDVFSKEKDEFVDKNEKSKADKYRIFAQAMLGKRNMTVPKELPRGESPAMRFVIDDDGQSNLFKRMTKSFGRMKRSYEQPKFKQWGNKNELAWSPESHVLNEDDDIVDSPLRHELPVQINESSDPAYSDEMESAHLEGKKRSISNIYAIPINDNNTPEIFASLRTGELKGTVPILSMVKKPKFDTEADSNERMKRSTVILENSTIPVANPKLEASTNSPNDTTTVPALPSEAPNDAKTEQSTTSSTQSPSTTTQAVGLQHDSSSLPEVSLESDNAKISRGYREISDDHNSDDDPITKVHHTIKANENRNLRPVSPFPKKPKTVIWKDKVKAKGSDNVKLNRPATAHTLTQNKSTSSVASTPEAPTTVVSQSRTLDQTTTTSISRQDADMVSELRSAIPGLKDTTEITTDSKTEDMDDELVTNSRTTKLPWRTKYSDLPPSDQAKIRGHLGNQSDASPFKPPTVSLREILDQKVKLVLERHNTKMADLRRRLALPTRDSHIRKREVVEDAYESTKNFLGGVTDSVSDNFKSFAHWFGQKSIELGVNLKRTRRDTETVKAPRPAKRDHNLQHLKEMIEARKNELHRQLQKLAEDKKAKKAHNAVVRPRRDLQKVMERAQELKQIKELRHNEYRKKLQRLAEERKIKNSHRPLLPKRNKRSIQDIRDKVDEWHKQIQVRHSELHKKSQDRVEDRSTPQNRRNKRSTQNIRDKVDELHKQIQVRHSELHKKSQDRVEDRSTPQNRMPSKPKTRVVKFEEPRHSTKPDESRYLARIEEPHHSIKPEEPHHQAKIEEPHHLSKIEEPHHLAKIEEPHYSSKTEEPKLPKSARKDTKKPKHHISRRDLTENHLTDNSGSDSIKKLHFRYFVDPILNAQEHLSFDPVPSNEFERSKRSLTDNEIIDDDDDDDDDVETKPNNSHHEDYQKAKLNRMSDLMRDMTKFSSKFNDRDSNYTAKEIESVESSPKNQTCQLVNYNVFGYLWCLAGKMIYYLL